MKSDSNAGVIEHAYLRQHAHLSLQTIHNLTLIFIGRDNEVNTTLYLEVLDSRVPEFISLNSNKPLRDGTWYVFFTNSFY